MYLTRRGRVLTIAALPAILPALITCACERYPDAFAPPAQRPSFEDPQRWQRVVHMTDVDAPDHFVTDIFDPLAANWRWAGKRPAIQLRVPAHALLKFHIEFAIPAETFASTGPVMLTFFVNERALGTMRYTAAGSYQFEKDIPAEWIAAGDIRLGAEIDKVVSLNGKTYGFLLIALGLARS
jgi:hypothetical protein